MTEFDDLQFMKNPHQWPNIVLPVKRYKPRQRSGFPEMGVLYQDKPVVYLTDMFATITSETPKIEYGSLEDIAADGWLVD